MSRKPDSQPDAATPPETSVGAGTLPSREDAIVQPDPTGAAADARPPAPMRPGRRGYVAKIAHELKTPLSAIVAASEVMRDEQFGPIGDERYRAYAKDIHESARHVLDVVNRVLAQRTADPEDVAFAFTDVDVEKLIDGIVSTMQPLAKRAGLSLFTRLEDASGSQVAGGLPKVIADLTSLRQILLNLITNALKFTPDGGRVGVVARHDSGRGLQLIVSDTGIGMQPGEVEAALAGTGQSQDGVRDERGLGIGLSLVKTLTLQNGAELAIVSQPGKGTSVAVQFPGSRLVLG